MIARAAKALLILAAAALVFGAVAMVFILPRLDFGARATPPVIEKRIAGFVLKRWIRLHAPVERNPIAATAENLKLGRQKFDDHCAPCHAADGTAHNVFGADFYPPIARLAPGAPGFTDGELFYVIANGIRYTAMPGFATQHDSDDIWLMMLWIRHLPNLSVEERREIHEEGERQMEHENHEDHEEHESGEEHHD